MPDIKLLPPERIAEITKFANMSDCDYGGYGKDVQDLLSDRRTLVEVVRQARHHICELLPCAVAVRPPLKGDEKIRRVGEAGGFLARDDVSALLSAGCDAGMEADDA